MQEPIAKMRLSVLFVAAGVLLALIAVLFVVLRLQGPESSVQDKDRSLVTFVSPTSHGAMWGWVTFEDRLVPDQDAFVTMKVSVAATDSTEISVVLGGSIALTEVHCFADGGEIRSNQTWADLTAVQQASVLANETTRPLSGVISDLEQDRTGDPESARARAELGTYAVVVPLLMEDRDISLTPDGGEERTYSTKQGKFECSVPASALWEGSGSDHVLSVPDVLGMRGTDGGDFGEQPVVYVGRLFTVDVSRDELAYASVEPTYDTADVAKFNSWWTTRDYTSPAGVSLAEVTVVLRPSTSEFLRQLIFLGIGLLGAAEIALWPLIARTIKEKLAD